MRGAAGRQNGFSLVELMVASVILAMVTAGGARVISSVLKQQISLRRSAARDSFMNAVHTRIAQGDTARMLSGSLTDPENSAFARCVADVSQCSVQAVSQDGDTFFLYDLHSPEPLIGSRAKPTRLTSEGERTACRTVMSPTLQCPLVTYAMFRREGNVISVWVRYEQAYVPPNSVPLQARVSDRFSVAVELIRAVCPNGQIAAGYDNAGQLQCRPTSCLPGQLFEGFSGDGKQVLCRSMNACPAGQVSKGFVLETAPDGSQVPVHQCYSMVGVCANTQYQAGFDAKGPICKDKNKAEWGLETDGTFRCPPGTFMRDIDYTGKPICQDKISPENGKAVILNDGATSVADGILCPENTFMNGMTKEGTPICTDYPTVWMLNTVAYCINASAGELANPYMSCDYFRTQYGNGQECGAEPFGRPCSRQGDVCTIYLGEDGVGKEWGYSFPANVKQNDSYYHKFSIPRKDMFVAEIPTRPYATNCWGGGYFPAQCSYWNDSHPDVEEMNYNINLKALSRIKIYRCSKPYVPEN